MRTLVALANYGTKNDAYLSRVIGEYRRMRHEVDIVVLSNLPKNLGADIQVVVGIPGKDPHSLPFAHKKIFAERLEDYDLFIYSEDDILITERNIAAFLKVTEILPEDEIAGFVHADTAADGTLYFNPLHSHFHWDPGSVRIRGEYTFAHFTNEHSACFLLTQKQLRRAIHSGGFLVGPHVGKYNLACSASTDPYTQCGFRKMICISHLDDFVVDHLPANKVGLFPFRHSSVFHRQIQALLDLQKNGRFRGLLLNPQTKVVEGKWSKVYYEPCRPEIVSLVPRTASSVLSIGCGWGATEGCLVERGLRVVGVPLDSVIAACAEDRGVEIVYGDFKAAREQLAHDRFDCVILSNILHLVRNPLDVLSSFAELLAAHGKIVATVPNFAQITAVWRRARRDPAYRDLGDYDRTGLHLTTLSVVREWFLRCRLAVERLHYTLPQRARLAHLWSLGLADPLLAEELIVVGKANESAACRLVG